MKYEEWSVVGLKPRREKIEGPGKGRFGAVAGATADWRAVMSILWWSWERRPTGSDCDISVGLYGMEDSFLNLSSSIEKVGTVARDSFCNPSSSIEQAMLG